MLQNLYTPYQVLAFQIIGNHYTVDLVFSVTRKLVKPFLSDVISLLLFFIVVSPFFYL